jgi:hypothetical protein
MEKVDALSADQNGEQEEADLSALPVCDKAFGPESSRMEDEDAPCRNAEN